MDRSLKAFLAVARIGNLTAAADRIAITQPALTKTIKRLEHEFNATLFERTSRGMVLTEEGAMLFDRAATIETHYRQAQEEIRARRSGALEEFRIAAGSAYHAVIAPELVRQLGMEFPKTRFLLSFEVAGSGMPKLIEGELDLMLGALLQVPLEGLETCPLLQVEIVPFCCRTNPLARLGKVAPADISGCEWVIYQRDRLMTERLGLYCLDHLMPVPRIAMEIDSLLASFQVVARTRYLTAATTLVRSMAEEVGLVMLPMDHPIWRFESGAWFRRSLRDYPIMVRSLEILRTLAGSCHSHG